MPRSLCELRKGGAFVSDEFLWTCIGAGFSQQFGRASSVRGLAAAAGWGEKEHRPVCSQPYVPLNLCLVSNLAALRALGEGVRGLAASVGCRDGEHWLASCSSELHLNT